MLVKKLVDEALILCDCYEGSLNDLSEELGFQLEIIIFFYSILYIECLKTLGDNSEYLDLIINDEEITNKVIKYLPVRVDNIFQAKEMFESAVDENNHILMLIINNKISNEEIEDIHQNTLNILLNTLDFNCETFDEATLLIYQQIKKITNRYY